MSEVKKVRPRRRRRRVVWSSACSPARASSASSCSPWRSASAPGMASAGATADAAELRPRARQAQTARTSCSSLRVEGPILGTPPRDRAGRCSSCGGSPTATRCSNCSRRPPAQERGQGRPAPPADARRHDLRLARHPRRRRRLSREDEEAGGRLHRGPVGVGRRDGHGRRRRRSTPTTAASSAASACSDRSCSSSTSRWPPMAACSAGHRHAGRASNRPIISAGPRQGPGQPVPAADRRGDRRR